MFPFFSLETLIEQASANLIEVQSKHVLDLEEMQRKQEEQMNAEKETIRNQFELLTNSFQQKEVEYQERINVFIKDKECSDAKQDEVEQKLKDLQGEVEKVSTNNRDLDSQLKEASRKLQEKDSSLETELQKLTDQLSKKSNEIQQLTCDKLELEDKISNDEAKKKKTHDAEVETLKKKIEDISKSLNLSLSNAKRIESESCKSEEKLQKSLDDQKKLETQNKKLSKQLEKLRTELDNLKTEAAKSGENPWEDEEWDGLTAAEKYEMLKHELVPAQQARLSKLCIDELQQNLEDTKNSLTSALVEKENMRADITKLEGKICYLEKSSSSSVPESDLKPALTTSSIVAPSKFKAPSTRSKKETTLKTSQVDFSTSKKEIMISKETRSVKKEENKDNKDVSTKKEELTNRRRSARSASSLANYMIAESMVQEPEETKKRSRRPEDGGSSKKSKKPKETVDEREPLSSMTNSPCKKTSSSTISSSLRGSRSKTAQKRNPEECKQQ